MSSSGGISTTLSPTKRKKRRKKVKITKKNEPPNIPKAPDKFITFPTLGEVSVIKPLFDIKEGEQGNIAIDFDNQLSERTRNEFNFVLPNLGEVILTNTDK
jgi:hypothetical protein